MVRSDILAQIFLIWPDMTIVDKVSLKEPIHWNHVQKQFYSMVYLPAWRWGLCVYHRSTYVASVWRLAIHHLPSPSTIILDVSKFLFQKSNYVHLCSCERLRGRVLCILTIQLCRSKVAYPTTTGLAFPFQSFNGLEACDAQIRSAFITPSNYFIYSLFLFPIKCS